METASNVKTRNITASNLEYSGRIYVRYLKTTYKRMIVNDSAILTPFYEIAETTSVNRFGFAISL